MAALGDKSAQSSLLDQLSTQEATLTVEVFNDGCLIFFQKHSPLLQKMIWFFISRFHFNTASESLPAHNTGLDSP